MSSDPDITAGLLVLGWLLLMALTRCLPAARRVVGLWIMVALGVPVLGWITWIWGPSAAIAGLALGTAAVLLALRRPARPTDPSLPMHLHHGPE